MLILILGLGLHFKAERFRFLSFSLEANDAQHLVEQLEGYLVSNPHICKNGV